MISNAGKVYRPNVMFRSADFNIVYPMMIRSSAMPYRRQRIELADGDFLDLDWLESGNAHLVVLFHGLEGSSRSHYICATAKLLQQRGYDVLAVNYRSCSGEMNRLRRFYHAGEIADMQQALSHATHKSISLVGFSLGGNIILKLLGLDHGADSRLRAGIAVSTPVALLSAAEVATRKRNLLYNRYFVRLMKQKMVAKHQQLPEQIDLEPFDEIRTLEEFDNIYTAPYHGYPDARTYYETESAINFMPNIGVPTLLLNAWDDPLLGAQCYPRGKLVRHPWLYLCYPRFGGHVSFTESWKGYSWAEKMIVDFLDEHVRQLT